MACRTARAKRELVRVVRTPDGHVMIDETGRHVGRGAYLCRDAACWTLGFEKGALRRALEAPIPAGLHEALLGGPGTMTKTEGGVRGQE